MNLAIDVGNTRIKAAVFENSILLKSFVFSKEDLITSISEILENYKIDKGVISAVSKIIDDNLQKLRQLLFLEEINHMTKVPFKNLYATPKTLGIDRICLVTAAVSEFSYKNVLVIDAGTCITYDFINKEKEYLGGAISPGLEMRYKSLPTFTSNLPLLSTKVPENFIGNSTSECIHSGVVNGVIQEIEGVINQYKQEYLDLTVVLTGGDINFLSKQLKSSIFANQNFLLQGLNELLIFNKSK